jgi:plastocyanin
MRYLGISAVAAGMMLLGACGGGDKQGADTTSAPVDTSAAATTTTTGSANAVAPAPITGTTHEVKMIGDDKGYRFDPASITIKAGDGIKYINVSGGPHNVAFDAATLPADVKDQLAANMPNTPTELSSPMLIQPNEAYTISFGNIKPGTYVAHCTPHLAMNMKQTITVE